MARCSIGTGEDLRVLFEHKESLHSSTETEAKPVSTDVRILVFDNNALTGKGSVACPGKTITGTFEYSRPKGPATIDFSDGRQLKVNFRDGLESGKGELTYPSGVLEAQVYVEGKTVLSIPRLPKSISATCAGIPENWALLQGKCGAAGIEGNAELVRTYDGDPASAHSYRAERISGIFKKGKAISEMRYETIPFSGSEPSIQILGNMNERLEFLLKAAFSFCTTT